MMVAGALGNTKQPHKTPRRRARAGGITIHRSSAVRLHTDSTLIADRPYLSMHPSSVMNMTLSKFNDNDVRIVYPRMIPVGTTVATLTLSAPSTDARNVLVRVSNWYLGSRRPYCCPSRWNHLPTSGPRMRHLQINTRYSAKGAIRRSASASQHQMNGRVGDVHAESPS